MGHIQLEDSVFCKVKILKWFQGFLVNLVILKEWAVRCNFCTEILILTFCVVKVSYLKPIFLNFLPGIDTKYESEDFKHKKRQS